VSRPVLVLLVPLLLAGCDDTRGGDAGASVGSDGGADAGGAVDAGAGADGGSAADGGAGVDSGVGVDAGADAGAVTDAGADAGRADAGWDGGVDGGYDAGVDAGVAARADHHVHIEVSNTCVMRVTPTELRVPRGQTAYLDWHNHSRDYPVDVWMSYGGGFTDLPTGATWDEPIGHCGTMFPHTEYADISTACSEHRFLIHCE